MPSLGSKNVASDIDTVPTIVAVANFIVRAEPGFENTKHRRSVLEVVVISALLFKH